MESKTYRPKYLLIAAVFIAQILCMNLAWAADEWWVYTICHKMEVEKPGIPEFFTELPSYYWGANTLKSNNTPAGIPSVTGGQNIVTNLGDIYAIEFDQNNSIRYPISGKKDELDVLMQLPTTTFKINESKPKGNYTIEFSADYVIANKSVKSKSSGILSNCESKQCRCKPILDQLELRPQPVAPKPAAREDSEAGVAKNVCSCTLL